MPTREEIAGEIDNLKNSGQDTIRKKYLQNLHEVTKRDTIIYFSSYNIQKPFPVPPEALSISQNDIQGFMASLHNLKGKELDLILHSPGGMLEAADQIVQYLRSKYKHIRAIIPQNAMSAATMLACASDEIVMGKHSAIGPIDPQMAGIPAHAILSDFARAQADVAANPMLANLWAQWLVSMPRGYLNLCEQTIQLSKQKVEEWLRLYMLRQDKPEKAREIADWLGNFEEHRTHGRPIGYELAKAKGLVVTRLEDDQALQEAVLSVFHATMVTFERTSCLKIIENHMGRGHYLVASGVVVQGVAQAQA
jgi:ATP-dependent protease ClpP protease subunit